MSVRAGGGRGLVFILVVALFGVLGGRPVAAHTDFESSSPMDGETVDAPVAEIVITFTGEATPFGDGFTVLDPQGDVRAPNDVTTADDKEFVLAFAPPLAGGVVGVRWHVQARDAHPIEGSFSFTVSAAAPTTTLASTTPAPATTVATTSGSAATEPAPTASPVVTTVTEPPTTDAVLAASDDSGDTAPTLEEFLATDTDVSGDGRQLAGRILSYIGLIGAIGGLAFLGTTLRGTRRELNVGLLAVRVLGLVTAIGAVIEYSGIVAASDAALAEATTSSPGLAAALRVVGGLVVVFGVTAVGPGRTQALSAAVIEDARTRVGGAGLERWDPRSAPAALVGVGLLVASFWFDGHTVGDGPRIVHAAVNSVHVLAAAVWVGGVVALAITMVMRHRRGEPSRATELIVRFSSIAATSLAAVVVAGLVMAIFVLDSFGELTSTEWGKILLLKTGAVAVAAAGGAYNHLRLRPALEARPDDERLVAEFRNSLVAEAIILVFVVVVTAWLVAAAT